MPASEHCDLLCIDLPRAESIRQALDLDAARSAAHRGRALADPTRLALALALDATAELCVCDLAWITGREQNLVGHHLRVLREAGLAESRHEHKFVFYALTRDGRRLLNALTAPAEASV